MDLGFGVLGFWFAGVASFYICKDSEEGTAAVYFFLQLFDLYFFFNGCHISIVFGLPVCEMFLLRPHFALLFFAG